MKLSESRVREILAGCEGVTRVETGPVRFGDDWAGVFIRGDNAFNAAMSLGAAAREVTDPLLQMTLTGKAKLFASCREPVDAFELPGPAEIKAILEDWLALREALEPFAEAADGYDPEEGDDRSMAWAHDFTIGSLRRARKALKDTSDA